ncbi:zinc metalloproteinase nas-31-like isoform X2 [Gigantopelta aegis]|uniref:zinc metalloproteinase nas-31-like isoform X2 n=1 Tax=Gigantopelta aegis TaxID=1735272 RepID=UPI001B887B57|nr:zinc metalloproteinase nas-31-like isoform X2 [Gigantopelta aegis]
MMQLAHDQNRHGMYGHTLERPKHRHRMKTTWLVVVLCVGLALCEPGFNRRSSNNGKEHMPRRKRAAFMKGRLWPNNQIPYTIKSGDFNPGETKTIKEVMKDWETVSCVRFVKKTPSHIYWIQFVNSKGCASYFGSMKIPYQKVYLLSSCFNKRAVAHELGHALGMIHEHTRPDRDNFVRINWRWIPTELHREYNKQTWNAVTSFGVPYDYLSIMHYSIGIETIQKDFQYKIGVNYISWLDIKSVNLAYPCTHCAQRSCPNGAFLGNTCKCWCKGDPAEHCYNFPIPGMNRIKNWKPQTSSGSCFPGDGQLLLDNGNMVDMKDLRTGQRVLTIQAGRRIFSEVKTFIKRHPHQNTTYRTLVTEQGNHVTMSDNHLIFASMTNTSAKMESRFAMSVKPGDYIFTTKSCKRDLCPEQVVQVSLSLKQGLYVPVTEAGTIVVDGIFASCYSCLPHHLEHFFLTPFRWFPWLLDPWKQDGFSPIISGLEYIADRFLSMSFHQSVKSAFTS